MGAASDRGSRPACTCSEARGIEELLRGQDDDGPRTTAALPKPDGVDLILVGATPGRTYTR